MRDAPWKLVAMKSVADSAAAQVPTLRHLTCSGERAALWNGISRVIIGGMS